MSTDGVVVDDKDGTTRHVQKCTRGFQSGPTDSALFPTRSYSGLSPIMLVGG
jgi:hypothetical protein